MEKLMNTQTIQSVHATFLVLARPFGLHYYHSLSPSIRPLPVSDFVHYS